MERFFYPEILADPHVDFVVVGEGERSLVELADYLAEGENPPPIRGVAFRGNGEIVFPGNSKLIADPDSIPFPAWDLINLNTYYRFVDFDMALGRGMYMGLFISRSCPYRCIYCHSIFSKGFRARSPENVLEEIDILTSRYGVKEFQIFDDCFNFDRNRVISITKGIIERGYNIRLSFPNGVRGDRLDEEVLSWLRKAGAYSLCMPLRLLLHGFRNLSGKILIWIKLEKRLLRLTGWGT